jgi:hypothetical protein
MYGIGPPGRNRDTHKDGDGSWRRLPQKSPLRVCGTLGLTTSAALARRGGASSPGASPAVVAPVQGPVVARPVGLFALNKQQGSQVTKMLMNMYQSQLSKAIFESTVDQSVLQSVSIRNLVTTGGITIGNITQKADLGATMQASSIVQQMNAQTGKLTQDLTQILFNMTSGLTFGKTTQKTKQKFTSIIQASQHTEQSTTTNCAVSQSVSQIVDYDGFVAGVDGIVIGDIDQSAKMEAFQTCNAEVAQSAMQSIDLSQSASQDASNTIKGLTFSFGLLLVILLVACIWAVVQFFKIAGENSYRYAPSIFMFLGACGIGYATYVLIENAKSTETVTAEPTSLTRRRTTDTGTRTRPPVVLATSNASSGSVYSTLELDALEDSQQLKNTGLYWWWPTVQAPLGFVTKPTSGTGGGVEVAHIYSNRTFSQLLSPDSAATVETETGTTLCGLRFADGSSVCAARTVLKNSGHSQNWFERELDDYGKDRKKTLPDPGSGQEKVRHQTARCYENASLRYVYTSWDFGGPELVRCTAGRSSSGGVACGANPGARFSDAHARLARAGKLFPEHPPDMLPTGGAVSAANIAAFSDVVVDPDFDAAPDPATGAHRGQQRWKNVVVDNAPTRALFESRGWARDWTSTRRGPGGSAGSGTGNTATKVIPGLFQQPWWGVVERDPSMDENESDARDRPSDPDVVNETLARAIPFFKHHVANDADPDTNFNVALFVGPYGTDAAMYGDADDSGDATGAMLRAWQAAGYSRESATPHFWYVMCFKMGNPATGELDPATFAGCVDDLGGTQYEQPAWYESCLNCDEPVGDPESYARCCGDFRDASSQLYWHGGKLESRAAADDALIDNGGGGALNSMGATFVQQNAASMLSRGNNLSVPDGEGDGTPLPSGGVARGAKLGFSAHTAVLVPSAAGVDVPLQDTFNTAVLGGYDLPRCNSAVQSGTAFCASGELGSLPGDDVTERFSSNECCRNSGCPTSDDTDILMRTYDPYDPDQRFKTNPGCWSSGMVPCVDYPSEAFRARNPAMASNFKDEFQLCHSKAAACGPGATNCTALGSGAGGWSKRDASQVYMKNNGAVEVRMPEVCDQDNSFPTPRLDDEFMPMLPRCKDVNPFGVYDETPDDETGAARYNPNIGIRLNVLAVRESGDLPSSTTNSTPEAYWGCDPAARSPARGDLEHSLMIDAIGGGPAYADGSGGSFLANAGSEDDLRRWKAGSNNGDGTSTEQSMVSAWGDERSLNGFGKFAWPSSTKGLACFNGAFKFTDAVPNGNVQTCQTAYSGRVGDDSALNANYGNVSSLESNYGGGHTTRMMYDKRGLDMTTGMSEGMQILEVPTALDSETSTMIRANVSDNSTQHCSTAKAMQQLAAGRCTFERPDLKFGGAPSSETTGAALSYCPGAIMDSETQGATASAPVFNVCGIRDIPGVPAHMFYDEDGNCTCEVKSQFENWAAAASVMCGGRYNDSSDDPSGVARVTGLARFAEPLAREEFRHITLPAGDESGVPAADAVKPAKLVMPYQDARRSTVVQAYELGAPQERGVSYDPAYSAVFGDEASQPAFDNNSRVAHAANFRGVVGGTGGGPLDGIEARYGGRWSGGVARPTVLKRSWRKRGRRATAGEVRGVRRALGGAAGTGRRALAPGGSSTRDAVGDPSLMGAKNRPFLSYTSYCDAAEHSLNDGYPIGPLCRKPVVSGSGGVPVVYPESFPVGVKGHKRESVLTFTDSSVVNAKYNVTDPSGASSNVTTFCEDWDALDPGSAGNDAIDPSTSSNGTGIDRGAGAKGQGFCDSDRSTPLKGKEWSGLHPSNYYRRRSLVSQDTGLPDDESDADGAWATALKKNQMNSDGKDNQDWGSYLMTTTDDGIDRGLNFTTGCDYLGQPLSDAFGRDHPTAINGGWCGSPAPRSHWESGSSNAERDPFHGVGVPMYKVQRSKTDPTDVRYGDVSFGGTAVDSQKITHLMAACRCPASCDNAGASAEPLTGPGVETRGANSSYAVPTFAYVWQPADKITIDTVGASVSGATGSGGTSKASSDAAALTLMAVSAASFVFGATGVASAGRVATRYATYRV